LIGFAVCLSLISYAYVWYPLLLTVCARSRSSPRPQTVDPRVIAANTAKHRSYADLLFCPLKIGGR
jgi:hypothetical protein